MKSQSTESWLVSVLDPSAFITSTLFGYFEAVCGIQISARPALYLLRESFRPCQQGVKRHLMAQHTRSYIKLKFLRNFKFKAERRKFEFCRGYYSFLLSATFSTVSSLEMVMDLMNNEMFPQTPRLR